MQTLSELLHDINTIYFLILITNLFNGISWLLSYRIQKKQSDIIHELMAGLVLYKDKLEADYNLDIPPNE